METRRIKILGFSLLLGGLVLCGIGLRLLLSPAQYQAVARIKLEPDADNSGTNISYDPYFIQTEYEALQSQIVLGKVVEALNLNVEWGKKYGGGNNLKTSEAIVLLKRRMNLRLVHNTRLTEISVTSEDPNEAAHLANAIAQSYQDYRLSARKQLIEKGIEVLEEKFKQGEQEIKAQREKVAQLKRKIPEPVPELPSPTVTHNPLPDNINRKPLDTNVVAYFEAARKLETMEEFHKLFADKIEAEKSLLSAIPKTAMVDIVDFARTPTSPVGRDYSRAIALFIIGLFPTAGGFLLLKSSSRQPV